MDLALCGVSRADLAHAVDVEHHGRHRCAHHPQADGAAVIQRGQLVGARAPVRHHGRQIADVRVRYRQRVAWQLALVPARWRAQDAVVRWVLNFLHGCFRCVTARPQQAPRCIAAGVLWIFATSVICARFVSPATGARWQSQVIRCDDDNKQRATKLGRSPCKRKTFKHLRRNPL